MGTIVGSWPPKSHFGLCGGRTDPAADSVAISAPTEAAFQGRRERYRGNSGRFTPGGVLLNWRAGGAAPTLCARSGLEGRVGLEKKNLCWVCTQVALGFILMP